MGSRTKRPESVRHRTGNACVLRPAGAKEPERHDAAIGSPLVKFRLPLVAALLYAALWPLMDVAFIAHCFPAPFLSGSAFFHRYSRTVGGTAEYAANLISQARSRHWAGVLVFTLFALAAWAIARSILRRFSLASCDWPAAAFAAIVLVLAGRYIAIGYFLPMLAGLAAAWLYSVVSEKTRDRRARALASLSFLMASIPLYFLLASGFLYLCLMCALLEFLIRKRPVWGLAWVAFGAAVPYGVSFFYYEPDVAARYLRWLRMPQYDPLTNSLLAAMYLFVPVGAVVAFLNGWLRIDDRLGPRFRLAVRIAGFAALALLASRLIALRFDKSGPIYADYLLDDGRPEEALACLAKSADDIDPERFLTFLALARTGRLPYEMFHYPQLASSDALLFRDAKWDTVPGIGDWRSDLYLELGRIAESQRWAHESLTVEGETPRVLERMALVYILGGNPDAAKTFLRALEMVPFHASRARRLMAALGRDPAMQADPLVARIRPLMLRHDYVGTWTTEQILQQCLLANPSNRMAFEYLLAHYLLTSDLEAFARLAPRLKDFYRDLPAHVQEALISFRNVNGSLPQGVDGSAIHPETEARFQTFLNVYLPRQNSPEDGWNALAPSFGGTYWFFYIFGRTAAGPPPSESRAGRLQGRPQ